MPITKYEWNNHKYIKVKQQTNKTLKRNTDYNNRSNMHENTNTSSKIQQSVLLVSEY